MARVDNGFFGSATDNSDIGHLIKQIVANGNLPELCKTVLINRLVKKPTDEEFLVARHADSVAAFPDLSYQEFRKALWPQHAQHWLNAILPTTTPAMSFACSCGEVLMISMATIHANKTLENEIATLVARHRPFEPKNETANVIKEYWEQFSQYLAPKAATLYEKRYQQTTLDYVETGLESGEVYAITPENILSGNKEILHASAAFFCKTVPLQRFDSQLTCDESYIKAIAAMYNNGVRLGLFDLGIALPLTLGKLAGKTCLCECHYGASFQHKPCCTPSTGYLFFAPFTGLTVEKWRKGTTDTHTADWLNSWLCNRAFVKPGEMGNDDWHTLIHPVKGEIVK